MNSFVKFKKIITFGVLLVGSVHCSNQPAWLDKSYDNPKKAPEALRNPFDVNPEHTAELDALRGELKHAENQLFIYKGATSFLVSTIVVGVGYKTLLTPELQASPTAMKWACGAACLGTVGIFAKLYYLSPYQPKK